MKRKLLASLTATIMFLALVLTGCPQAVDPDKETTQKPSSTTQKIEAVKTIGEMGKPEAATDGTITLTTTDSTGGKYTFKQIGGGVSSIRSASNNGSWNYTNSKGIKQYEGSFNGDITKEGANNLNLTVEKAADANGTLQEVTEPQSFNFEVSASGTFAATIPAVEIVVQKEQTSDTPKLIKTVTRDNFFSSYNKSSIIYYDEEEIYTIDFFSDKTFIYHYNTKRTLNGVDFSYTVKGTVLEGTYTGNPLVDGPVMLNVQKWNKFLASGISVESPKLTEIFTSYQNGETSKTITQTEADLTPFTGTWPVSISGDTFFDVSSISTYTQNDDGSTTFKLEVVGDDVELFKLRYQLAVNNGDGSHSSTSSQDSYTSLSETITIPDATENTAIAPELYIDKDGNGVIDSGTDIIIDLIPIDLKLGHHTTAVVDIKKYSINFAVTGNTNQYQNIHINAGYGDATVPMADNKIDIYVGHVQNSASFPFINLTAEEHVSGDYLSTYDISDSIELYPNEGSMPSSITFTLYDKLEEGEKIAIQEYPTDSTFSDEEKKHFRFVKEENGNLIFYIPTGTGSDGEFLSNTTTTSYGNVRETLISFTYLGLGSAESMVENNHRHQFAGLVDNMKDIVYFLEHRMKLTVAGKDLIGL
ncbi:MAG: hypothetical protein J6R67_07635 [Treponema sp.]|nr:hypothetical protein [Treponema sp.]